MLASKHSVYLSGDFRLTYLRLGSIKDDLLIQKIVPVIKRDFGALVAFCGVAKTPSGLEVGNWIADIAKLGGMFDSLEDFIGRLQEADKWLAKVSQGKQLAISLVGFKKKKPFVVSLSNFQGINGQLFSSLSPNLVVEQLWPGKPIVRILGVSDSVFIDEKKQLLSRLSLPQVLELDSIAELNVSAAGRSRSISKECVVGRLLPTGAGHVRPFGIDENKEYMPGFVKQQMKEFGYSEFELKTTKFGVPLPPGWVQMAFKRTDEKWAILHEFRNIISVGPGVCENPAIIGGKTWIAGPNEPTVIKI